MGQQRKEIGKKIITKSRDRTISKKGTFLNEKGWGCCLQKEKRGQSPIQVKRDSVVAALSNGFFIQVT